MMTAELRRRQYGLVLAQPGSVDSESQRIRLLGAVGGGAAAGPTAK
ncbi:hypothetical protein [Streptomyces sp. NPDC050164]